MDEIELRPCPFCGAAGEELGCCYSTGLMPMEGRDWFVRCYVCHVETAREDTAAEATAAWNRRAAVEPVWPSIGEIQKAGWAWRNDKERETDSDDQRYFEHNWHSLPGLGKYVTAEIMKRPEFAALNTSEG